MNNGVILHCGDSLEVLIGMEPNSIDAIVTDPPYGISFMGNKWDYDIPSLSIFQQCLRVLKPGGHMLAFSGTRTQHRMATRIEDAGFDIRDMIAWVYGQGFPKSHNGAWGGTALKPALEPITMARKPLIGTVECNWAQYGTGGLSIDECRVGDHAGRWPANLIHDGSDEVISAFPESMGQRGDLKHTGRDRPSSGRFGDMAPPHAHAARIEDDKSASRFFYCSKVSKSERGDGNNHPTVKPVSLMQYLIRLVTPAGGTVLDPFMGSGSTGIAARKEGVHFIGIDIDASYVEIARQRTWQG